MLRWALVVLIVPVFGGCAEEAGPGVYVDLDWGPWTGTDGRILAIWSERGCVGDRMSWCREEAVVLFDDGALVSWAVISGQDAGPCDALVGVVDDALMQTGQEAIGCGAGLRELLAARIHGESWSRIEPRFGEPLHSSGPTACRSGDGMSYALVVRPDQEPPPVQTECEDVPGGMGIPSAAWGGQILVHVAAAIRADGFGAAEGLRIAFDDESLELEVTHL